MEISTNLGFYLPSSNSDDIADINQISDNFRNLDEYLPGMFREVGADIRRKQDALVSGVNIKSVNGESLLGEGDLELSVEVDQTFDAKSQNAQSGVAIANTFANALKGSKSGEIVSMSDVSPIEHNVGVKVSGVEDLTAVSVKRYGKNLCDIEMATVVVESNYTLKYPLKKGIAYCFSAFVESTDTDAEYCSVRFYDSNWNYISGHWIERGNANYKVEFTPNVDVKYIYFLASTSADLGAGDTATFSNILITLKGNDTVYEPFIEPITYTPNADGTVDGVTSLYPSMTLATDTSGVTIDAEYNRDINKAFAELQNAVINMGGTL